MPVMMGYRPVDASEREVWDRLKKQAPAEWVIIANPRWTRRKSSDGRRGPAPVRDGEADFVVLIPGQGMVVLEVKGSNFIRIGSDGRWYRRETPTGPEQELKESPVQQATRNLHDITNALLHHMRISQFPGYFGYAAIYPKGQFVPGQPPHPFLDSSTLMLRADMDRLVSRIREVLTARRGDGAAAMLTSAQVKAMADALVHRPFDVVPADTTDDMMSDADGIARLMPIQHAALEGLFRHKSVAVTGPAGSGKTVLALWRLAAAVDAGERALYLCFNKSLAEHLRGRNPDLASHIQSVDQWFAEIARLLNVTLPRKDGPGSDVYYSQQVPNTLYYHEDRITDAMRYDLIIVDEGQDFGTDRLMAIQALLSPGGSYIYFADGEQNLYGRSDVSNVFAEVAFALRHNCRNTVRINETKNQILRQDVMSMPGMPEGTEPLFRRLSSGQGMANAAWEMAKAWADGGRSVAILSPFTLEKSVMHKHQKGHGLVLSLDARDLGKPGVVVFSTIKSFKGIEADSVVVVDLIRPVDGTFFTRDDVNVACTRGRVRLALLSLELGESTWREELGTPAVEIR